MPAPATHALPRVSHWPAMLDLAQSLSGLLLALFMWFHMCFVSAILLSEDAAWIVARFFEAISSSVGRCPGWCRCSSR